MPFPENQPATASPPASDYAGGDFPTASPVLLGLACCLAGTGALIALVQHGGLSTTQITLLVCAAYAVPGIIYEYVSAHGWRLPRSSGVPMSLAIRRALPKSFALAQILLLAYVLSSILPEYKKDLYRIWMDILPVAAAITLVLSLPYFIFCEKVLGPKRDLYQYVGRYTLLVFFYRVWTRPFLRQAGLLWAVKLFFLPIMVGSLHYSVVFLTNNLPSQSFSDFFKFFDLIWELILAIDVTLAVVGYVCSLRLLNTEVVSTDPTWRGWVATLICYSPFSTVLYGSYLTYEDGLRWGDFFHGHHTAYVVYGSTLLFLHFLYLAASLNFGIRYSNLSHRGILTDGLFRLTKHPAYLFKNIVWWMIGLPFITNQGSGVAIANCFLLLCVNAVYWWRARTEEMHLSRDPAYVAYALSMNDRSILAFMGKVFPALAYKPPAGYLESEYRVR